MKKYFLFLAYIFVIHVTMSCAKDDYAEEMPSIVIEADGDSISTENAGVPPYSIVEVSLYASNGRTHQSAAAYGDYAFFVTDRRSALYFYNLKSKRLICGISLGAVNERTTGNYILYHCNQMNFGVDFYNRNDPFPLLYISQRARSDTRCIVEVYRLLPVWDETESEYTSLNADLVQTIYFPIQTFENALGRNNCVFDADNRLMYTYSYSTLSGAPDYGQCRVTCFDIPDIYQEEIILNESDIIESFKLNYDARNSQGGCIKDERLFIAQGYSSVGIYLNVISLKDKRLLNRFDLSANGITWEPEGCFEYNGSVMVASGKSIWEFKFY